MTKLSIILQFIISSVVIENSRAISSPLAPFTTYKHSIELQKNVADLWWTVDDNEREITFELHMNTTGWIALGISPAGGMKGADIGVGWVDQTGSVYFQSGTNNLIFAYGLTDPVPSGPNGEITYHENRRGSRTLPLRSYADPPSEDIFAGLDYVEFRLNNYVVPPTDTTYHCKIYKAPSNYSVKRHAIGHKTIVDSASQDLVHHLLMYECDSTAQFDDNNLPDGLCDQIYQQLAPCASNIATGWAVGGDYMVAFPKEAGYPVGGDFPIKYYMVQMHYDNPNLLSNRTDNSGIRFYIGKELRQYDLGYLTFGTDSSAAALAIPPKVERFIVDSSSFNYTELQQWLLNLTWTPERAVQWQEFYNTVSRVLIYGAAPNLQFDMIPSLPKYEDLKPVPCTQDTTVNESTTMLVQSTMAQCQSTTRPSQTVTISDQTTRRPDQTMTMPSQITTGTGQTLTVPDQTTTRAGQTMTMPGQTTTMVGQTLTVPDQTTTRAGQTMTMPGQTTTWPGQTFTVSHQTTTRPDETTRSPSQNMTTPDEIMIMPGETTSTQDTRINKAISYYPAICQDMLVFLNLISIVMTIILD
ncbi:unnamed protein product [Rotaria sp. Silwood2]|nr:unnamed protein product [Rotaria sp. Silwood2]